MAIGLAGLAFAAPAQAKFAPAAQFTLRGTHGYRVIFHAQGRGQTYFAAKAAGAKLARDSFSILAERGSSFATYQSLATGGRFRPDGLQGRIGDLGRARVRFHPRRHWLARVPGCRGHVLRTAGVFTGHIDFHGENGFTRVRASRASGRVDRPRGLRCGSSSSGHAIAGTQLNAKSIGNHGKGATLVHVFRPQHQSLATGRTTLLAERIEVQPSYVAYRGFATALERRDFLLAPLLASAHLDPVDVSPLSGSASFLAPHAWLGSLTGDFPGRPDVPLSGPAFAARLVQR